MRFLCRRTRAVFGWGEVLLLLCLLLAPGTAHALGTLTGTPITNQAVTNYDDVNSNHYTAQSNTVTVTVSSVYSVSISCSPDQTATPNLMVYYGCTVTNNGNDHNTFTLTSTVTGGWTTALYADPNGDGQYQDTEAVTSSSGDLAADGTYKFLVGVKMPHLTPNGTVSKVTVTATGTGAGAGATFSLDRNTTGQAPSVTVHKKVRNVSGGTFADSGVTAKPGDKLEYQVTVTNGGSIKATNVILTDALDSHVAYVPRTLYAGSDGNASVAAGNSRKTDANEADDTACPADTDACATGINGANSVTFRLGRAATESTGGTLEAGGTVFVYYQVAVQ